MRDLTNPRWMYTKAALLLLGGLLASTILLLDCPSWKHAAVLAVAVWCFCRAYYFAFYVIEHYVDPGFKFAGLTSVLRYWSRRQK